MKKTMLMLFLAMLIATGTTFAQQKQNAAEVLYFKGKKGSNTTEAKVKKIIEKNWADGTVKFRPVKLYDPLTNELVKSYNAKPQTLLIVVTRQNKETSTDISAILRLYASNKDSVQLEKELTDKIREALRE